MFIEERKFDPNDADYDGRTALHLACEEGNLEAVQYHFNLILDMIS